MFKSKHSKILSISAICNLNLAGDIHTSANDLIFFFFLKLHQVANSIPIQKICGET